MPAHVCVILDEAYCEFSLALGDPYASVELLRRWPNLVLLRTFSKVYGLAGLRAGYALCGSAEFRIAVEQVRQPFYLNVAAQAAAVEALRHQDEVERRVAATIAARVALERRLRASSDCGWPTRTPTSCGCACPRTPAAERARSSAGCGSAACSSAPADLARARRARCGSPSGTEGERRASRGAGRVLLV